MINFNYGVTMLARQFYDDNINKVPVNLDNICYIFGWELRQDDLCGEDGYVFILDESKKVYIFYDNSRDFMLTRRYRFTISHEIGHLILGHYELDQSILSDDDLLLLEREANIFAAEILMPYSELKSLECYDIKFLANQFKVSKDAMETRLDCLGLKKKQKIDYNIQFSHNIVF